MTLNWRRMPVVSVLRRKYPKLITCAIGQTNASQSHIKGVASHKILSDGEARFGFWATDWY